MKLRDLAEHLQCRLDGDGEIEIVRIASLEPAEPGDLTFLANPRYHAKAMQTAASAIIADDALTGAPCAVLRSALPYLAFARALAVLAPAARPPAGVHHSAVVDDGAQIDPEAALLSVNEGQLPQVLQDLRAPDGMVRFLPAGVDTSRNMLRMRSTFHRVLEGLAGRYVIIVNGPRLPGPVPTSQLLSLADATLMVVTEGETGLNDARSAGDTLRSFSTGASGVIVLRR